MVLLKHWRPHTPLPQPWNGLEWLGFSKASSSPPPKTTIHPFMHYHLSAGSKIQLCSSKGGECGVIGVLLLGPITSHHFISMRERRDIKFPRSGLSISQSKPNTGLLFTGGFVSSTRGI